MDVMPCEPFCSTLQCGQSTILCHMIINACHINGYRNNSSIFTICNSVNCFKIPWLTHSWQKFTMNLDHLLVLLFIYIRSHSFITYYTSYFLWRNMRIIFLILFPDIFTIVTDIYKG